jgi:hypothetical protein
VHPYGFKKPFWMPHRYFTSGLRNVQATARWIYLLKSKLKPTATEKDFHCPQKINVTNAQTIKVGDGALTKYNTLPTSCSFSLLRLFEVAVLRNLFDDEG